MNFYPVEEAKNSNLRHRPIGIGVQGLADAFILMRFPFDRSDIFYVDHTHVVSLSYFNTFLYFWQQVVDIFLLAFSPVLHQSRFQIWAIFFFTLPQSLFLYASHDFSHLIGSSEKFLAIRRIDGIQTPDPLVPEQARSPLDHCDPLGQTFIGCVLKISLKICLIALKQSAFRPAKLSFCTFLPWLQNFFTTKVSN